MNDARTYLMTPEPIQKFVEFFSAIPSIGPRQATRLAFYLANQGKEFVVELAERIRNLSLLSPCPRCFNTVQPAARGLCAICGDPGRRHDLIAIVEKETDVLSFERTRRFNGRYLVIGALTKDGVLTSMQKLRMSQLKDEIRKDLRGQAEEIILALNPTTYGDVDAALVRQELKPFAKKITRLGRGLPTGGEIEFADEETLGGALEHRS